MSSRPRPTVVGLSAAALALTLTGGLIVVNAASSTESAPPAATIPDPTPTTAPTTAPATAPPSTTATSAPTGPVTESVAGAFRIAVDPATSPSVPDVEGFADGDAPRPVGRLANADDGMDVVLDELIVSTRDDAELTALLERWDATLVDTFPVADGDEFRDHLVRIDPATADPVNAAAHLLALEPHDGELRVSDARVLALLAALAAESTQYGTDAALNVVAEAAGVEDGTAQEASDLPNPFTWSYLQGGGTQDFAVAPAWQLLEAHGRLTRSVDILINDGGFNSNADFPDNVTLRLAKWGEESRSKCSGGNPCPYHGTDVTLTAMGQLDNEYGTVGPAGPVVDEAILVAIHKDGYKRLRKLDEMVDTYRPDVVNMSYGGTYVAAQASTERIMNRRYEAMTKRGALLVAAAGNDGYDIDQTKCIGGTCYERRLVLPCESTYVLCVGGLDARTISRDSGSNFGAEDNRRSVEIWGPYDIVTINDPIRPYLDYTTTWKSGTSFASPFVAGVAALVKAADPSLTNEEVRTILADTANTGVQNAWITGSQRRVDALAAVAAALGVDLGPPQVDITFPTDGEDYPVSEWLQLKGTALDHRGEALPIRWESDIDGVLGEQIGTVSLGELSVGTHVLTATAVDSVGDVGVETITFDVVRRPIEITISSPGDGDVLEDGDPLVLAAGTADPDDFWSSLPDGKVLWEIVRSNGSIAWSADRHDRIVPPGTIGPGDYEIRFSATAHGTTVSESVHVTVEALPPGHTKPVPKIHTPAAGTVEHTGGGKVELHLTGSATDAEDGALPGTRFRWVARAGGEEVVLCTGSQFVAPTELGKIVAAKDCSDVTVELGVAPTAPGDWTWQLYLEVRDHASDHGSAVVPIDIEVAVG